MKRLGSASFIVLLTLLVGSFGLTACGGASDTPADNGSNGQDTSQENDVCQPACDGKVCGDDGCGGTCGDCTDGQECSAAGLCESTCVPDCGDNVCGDDGCGGSCGLCAGEDEVCEEGACVVPPPTSCQDPSQIDITTLGITHRIHKFGIGGFDPEVDAVCDELTAGNVDADPNTSFPDGVCENGLENALLGIVELAASLAQTDLRVELAKAISDGSVNIITDMQGYANDGTVFTVSLFNAGTEESNTYNEETSEWSECDITTLDSAPCNYLIDPESFTPECNPLVVFADAIVVDGHLTLGGPGTTFVLQLPISALDATLNLSIIDMTLKATVIEDENGVPVQLENGLITGILPEEGIMDIIANLGGSSLPAGFDPSTLIGFLQTYLDIDTDGDGETDALSVGVGLEAIPATITGVK